MLEMLRGAALVIGPNSMLFYHRVHPPMARAAHETLELGGVPSGGYVAPGWEQAPKIGGLSTPGVGMEALHLTVSQARELLTWLMSHLSYS